MSRGSVVTVRVVAVLALVVASVSALVPPLPAGAQEDGPQLTLSPASDVNPFGQMVEATGSGFASAAQHIIGTCLRSAALDFSNPPSLLNDCDIQGTGGPVTEGTPFSANFELTADDAAWCYPARCLVVLATYSGFFTFGEVVALPLDFATPPPPPPNDPNFSFGFTPEADVADGGEIAVTVLNRNPATQAARVYLCPAGVEDPGTTGLNRTCESVASVNGAADWSFTASVPRFINESSSTRVDCALEACELVYDASGNRVWPVDEYATAPIGFAGSPILTVSPTDGVAEGDEVSVQWAGYREAPDPTFEVVHYVGVCQTSPNGGVAFEDYCEGGEVAAATGTAQVSLPQSVSTTSAAGTVDCLNTVGPCSVVYGSYYLDARGERRQLHYEYRPLTYSSQVIINNDETFAVAGDSVSVVAVNQPTADGAFAFAMVCVVTGFFAETGLKFVCSGDVGTVETNFDGNFDGSVVVPESFVSGGVEYNCRVWCVVALAVLDPNLELLVGHGKRLVVSPAG